MPAEVAVGSFFAFLLLFSIEIFSQHGNPYMGVLAYQVAPMCLLLGIVLVLLGYWLHLRQERLARDDVPLVALIIDLSRSPDLLSPSF